MAQVKNTSEVKSNRLFKGIYDIKFNFKDKNYKEVNEGEVIYSKGDKSEYMYLVIRGRVKFKIYENPRQPKVFLVSKNEFFGEKELIDKTIRSSSALAEKNTLLFQVNYKDFVRLSADNRKIMENLNEKKYEEVVPASRRADLKDDIFKRIINDPEKAESKEKGIELRDNSYENPLLELKAKDEINEELKMYEEEDGINETTIDEISIDDIDVKWEFNDEEEKTEETLTIDDESTEVIAKAEDVTKPDETVVEETPPENILENFKKIQDQVNIFRDSLNETETNQFDKDINEIPLPVEPLRVTDNIPIAFVKAVEKLSSVINKEETHKIIVEACAELVNAERGIIYFPDLNNVLKGKIPEEETEVIAGSDTIPGRCLRESRIINIRDVFNDPNFNPSVDYVSYFHIHSLICIPIPEGPKITAVLQLFNNRDGEFSVTDEEMLKSITPVLYRSLERSEHYSKEERIVETKISEIIRKEEKIPVPEIKVEDTDKKISLKILSDFLLQEFKLVVGDIKQFNSYLQRTDISGEIKEIADIVTNQTSKITDLLDALKLYSDKNRLSPSDTDSYITILNDMVSLLAEYTESRKVNLYKRFDTDAKIDADPKFLYLALFQLIKYQCDLMPFGGNIFISSVKSDGKIEITIRNATRKTDESLIIKSEIVYNENTPQGLGLSLAKRIIEDHNASISIKNGSGTGLEISILFPIAG